MEEYGDHDQNSALLLLCKHIAAVATLHVGRVTAECVATLVTAHINASIAIDATADLFGALQTIGVKWPTGRPPSPLSQPGSDSQSFTSLYQSVVACSSEP